MKYTPQKRFFIRKIYPKGAKKLLVQKALELTKESPTRTRSDIARELGVNADTLYGWLRKYSNYQRASFTLDEVNPVEVPQNIEEKKIQEVDSILDDVIAGRELYSKSFKDYAIEKVISLKNDDPTRTFYSIAKELKVKDTQLFGWVFRYHKNDANKDKHEFIQQILDAALVESRITEEIKEELAKVTEERDLLNKAVLHLAKQIAMK
jgi:transposase-like protein